MKSGSSSANIFFKSKFKIGSGSGALLLASLGLLCLCALGCRQHRATQLTAAQVHQVTQELAKGASDAASDESVIKIRRVKKSSLNTGVDELYIGLRGDVAAKDRVRQKLEGVATKHRLTVDATINDGNTSRITLRSNGIATHHIVIEMLALRLTEVLLLAWRFFWMI